MWGTLHGSTIEKIIYKGDVDDPLKCIDELLKRGYSILGVYAVFKKEDKLVFLELLDKSEARNLNKEVEIKYKPKITVTFNGELPKELTEPIRIRVLREDVPEYEKRGYVVERDAGAIVWMVKKEK